MSAVEDRSLRATRSPAQRAVDPWGDVPLALRRYWSVLVVAAVLAAGWLWLRALGVASAGVVLVVSAVVLPARINLVAAALGALWWPDGAPRRRLRRLRRALAGCPGVVLPARLRCRTWWRVRSRGLEVFVVRCWPGDHLERWPGARAAAIRAAFGAASVEIAEYRPGEVRVTLHYHSPGSNVRAPQLDQIAGDVAGEGIALGETDGGETMVVPLDQGGVLISGVPGAGKSSVLQLVCASVAADSAARLVVIDGKGGSELSRWEPAAAYCATDLVGAVEIVQRLEEQRRHRELIRGNKGWRSWPPGTAPTVVVVIDELAVLCDITGLTGDARVLRQRFARLLVDLVRLGRADRMVVVAATQRPSADAVPTALRDLMGVRVAMRCTTAEQARIALGAAYSPGADPCGLPPTPGAMIVAGHHLHPQRGRAFWLTDQQLDHIVSRARPDQRATNIEMAALPSAPETSR